jgi:catechol 2,3-dioxygenase-like lactoylglutathione lyase family enzyme
MEDAMATYEYNHTHVVSSNPGGLVDFFRQVMGVTDIQERLLQGQKAWDVSIGSLVLRISGNTAADEALKMRKETPQPGFHHLALTVSNLDEAVRDLKKSGVEFIIEPKPGTGPAFIRTKGNILFELIQKR